VAGVRIGDTDGRRWLRRGGDGHRHRRPRPTCRKNRPAARAETWSRRPWCSGDEGDNLRCPAGASVAHRLGQPGGCCLPLVGLPPGRYVSQAHPMSRALYARCPVGPELDRCPRSRAPANRQHYPMHPRAESEPVIVGTPQKSVGRKQYKVVAGPDPAWQGPSSRLVTRRILQKRPATPDGQKLGRWSWTPGRRLAKDVRSSTG